MRKNPKTTTGSRCGLDEILPQRLNFPYLLVNSYITMVKITILLMAVYQRTKSMAMVLSLQTLKLQFGYIHSDPTIIPRLSHIIPIMASHYEAISRSWDIIYYSYVIIRKIRVFFNRFLTISNDH